MMIYLLILLFPAFAVAEDPKTFLPVSNKDCPGSDIKYLATNYGTCAKNCQDTKGCVAFVMNNGRTQCWLKRSCSNQRAANNRIVFKECGPCPAGSRCLPTKEANYICTCPEINQVFNTITKRCQDSSIKQLKGIGCFVADSDLPLTVKWSTLSPQKCISYCKGKGHFYSGLQNGDKCTCGNSYGSRSTRKSSSECNKPCSGNEMFQCGGTNRNSIFKTGYKACKSNSCESGRKCVNTDNGLWCSCKVNQIYNEVQRRCFTFGKTERDTISTKAFEALRTGTYESVLTFTTNYIDPIFTDVVRICSTESANSEMCQTAEICKTMKLLVSMSTQFSDFRGRVVVMTTELRDMNLKTFLNELQDKSVASKLLYDVSTGLNTIISQIDSQFKSLGTYFKSVAEYNKAIATQDRIFLEGQLETLKKKSKQVGKQISEDLRDILISAVATATVEVATRIVMLATEIAVGVAGMIDILPDPPNPNDIADRAADLGKAINDLAEAVILFQSLDGLSKQGRELAKKFEDNKSQMKVLTALIDNIKGDISEEDTAKFIEGYGNYSPKVTNYDIQVFVAQLEKVATSGCDLFLGQESVAAQLAIGINVWGKAACRRIESTLAGMTALYEEIYEYQFDLVDSYAKIVKGNVATTFANKIGTTTAKIDLKGLVQGMILDQGQLQTVATVYCNQLEYNTAGVRPSYCNKKYYNGDDINKIVSLDSGLEVRARQWTTTTFIPTTNKPTSKAGEINVADLLKKIPVTFTLPVDVNWLVANKWVRYSEDLKHNVYYIKSIEPIMPHLKCASAPRFIVSTGQLTNLYEAKTSTSYLIDEKNFQFDYNRGFCPCTRQRVFTVDEKSVPVCTETDGSAADHKIPTSLYNQRWTIQFFFHGCSQTNINEAAAKLKQLPILVSYKYLNIDQNQREGGMDFCYPNPCKNGGTCGKHSTLQTFKCSCKNGASGDTCETLPDYCTKSNKICQGGLCQNQVGSAKCICGEYEPFAVQSKCLPNNCATHDCGSARCQNTALKAVCVCPTGQTYILSQKRCKWLRPCDKKPCGSYSTCYGEVPNTQRYTCGCVHGFTRTGGRCVWNNPCNRKPCDSKATRCTARTNTQNYYCTCRSGYKNVANRCKFIPVCGTRYTGWNSRGGGDAVYLDRHRLICPGYHALKYFRLERSGNSIRYRYICCTVESATITKYQDKTTNFNGDGNGNIVYLDRHEPYCSGNSVMRYFYLERDGSHKNWRYRYGCNNLNKAVSCYTTSTGFTSDGGGKVEYLDRNYASCGTDYYIKSFKLNRSSNHKYIRYTVRCCKLS